MSQKPVLGYWKIRGLAQPIRLLLVYVGQDFEDKYYECGPGPEYNRDCWFNEKFTLGLDFPNLPYYIDGDVKLTQSKAILRHIAHRHGLTGKTETERDRQELSVEEATDLWSDLSAVCYSPNFESQKPNFVTRASAKLKEIDKFLGGRTWFAGDHLTFVDFMWYELLDVLNQVEPTLLERSENLQKFHRRFQALPAIKQYMESDRFLSRPINNKIASFGSQ